MSKLLFVVNHSEFFTSHRLPLAQAARKNGWEVHIATSETAMIETLKAEFEHVHVIPVNAGGISLKDDLFLSLCLFQLFRRIRPDVVHFITLKPIIWGGLASLLSEVPNVIFAVSGLGHYFGPVRGYGVIRFLIKQLVTLATSSANSKIIVQNDSDFEFFTRFPGITKQKFVFIRGSGVDGEKVIRSQPQKGDPVRVLFASRLLKSKGVLDFIAVARRFQHLEGANKDARFEIAGAPDNNNPQTLTTEDIHEIESEGVIRYHGHVSDMSELFSQVSVFCLPTYYGEGVPKVLIEAMAAGLPLVTSDTAGCQVVVNHGENGYTVRSRDVDGLFEVLLKLIQDPEIRATMGAVSLSAFRGDFLLSTVVSKHLKLYASKGWQSETRV